MSTLRYQITIALTKADNDRLQKLKKRGIKVVEIVRRGIEVMSAQEALKDAEK